MFVAQASFCTHPLCTSSHCQQFCESTRVHVKDRIVCVQVSYFSISTKGIALASSTMFSGAATLNSLLYTLPSRLAYVPLSNFSSS